MGQSEVYFIRTFGENLMEQSEGVQKFFTQMQDLIQQLSDSVTVLNNQGTAPLDLFGQFLKEEELPFNFNNDNSTTENNSSALNSTNATFPQTNNSSNATNSSIEVPKSNSTVASEPINEEAESPSAATASASATASSGSNGFLQQSKSTVTTTNVDGETVTHTSSSYTTLSGDGKLTTFSQSATIFTQTAKSAANALSKALAQVSESNKFNLDLDQIKDLNTTVEVSDADFRKLKAEKPPKCDNETNCDWICEHFIKNGMIQMQYLTIGGESESKVDFASSEEESSDSSNNRLLSSKTVWEPLEGESGVTVGFEVDDSDSDDFDSAPIAMISQIAILLSVLAMIMFWAGLVHKTLLCVWC